jgi:hypothetical protein
MKGNNTMSMRYYPFRAAGAIIRDEDFDTTKLITSIAKKRDIELSKKATDALIQDNFNQEAAEEIYTKLELPDYTKANATDYSGILRELLDDKDNWIEDYLEQDSNGITLERFVNVEANFYIGNDEEYVENTLVFTLDSPLPWEIDNYTGPKSKKDVVALIENAAKELLKDDIDWESRLGQIIGAYFG